jgi:hypothetical protein
MAGGSDKERAKRRRSALTRYGAAWAALTLVYIAARAYQARALPTSLSEAFALLLLEAVFAWALLASAGDFGDGGAEAAAKVWKRGGVGLESGPDYFVLAAAAKLLHLWPRAASGGKQSM